MMIFSVRRFPLIFLLNALLFSISGCSLMKIHEQIQITESAGVIKGRVEVTPAAKQRPVIVKRYYLDKTAYVNDTFVRATPAGDYTFSSLPGTYFIAAFVDSNKDGIYQPETEGSNYYSIESGKPAPIKVETKQTVVVPLFTISGKPPVLSEQAKSRVAAGKIISNIGKVNSLDSPLFAKHHYTTGMWRPIEFLQQVGGGLFMLREYQPDKIPVLFVHGINGGPLNWKSVIDSMDPDRFQPWVLYYPSGIRLDMITDYMVKAISHLQDRYGFDKLYLVGHSMGGLVSRSFIKKYRQRHPDIAASIRLLITINSPLNGMRSAASGVEKLPIVLPVWRDIATGSDFLEELNAWPWPKDIPYHLVFSYISGQSDDGIVPLQSEIPLKIQQDAVRMYGFNNTHAGTLKDAEFLVLFNEILAGGLD